MFQQSQCGLPGAMRLSSCPIDYRYAPDVLNRPAEGAAETAYIVGGLYGNVEALDTILAMARMEERKGPPVLLVFNGDFHWFDATEPDFLKIQRGVLPHWALSGNVEAELARQGLQADCGCSYPEYVSSGVVERSNRIFARLKGAALRIPGVQRDLARLPRHGVLEVGGQRIAILHGDAHSLSGWTWAAEALLQGSADGKSESTAAPQAPDRDSIAADFRAADVVAFATTHTCLPFLYGMRVDGQTRVIINNGSAGMANFHSTEYGLITRISSRGDIPTASIYGVAAHGLRFDALPVRFDAEAWRRRFLATWPPRSDAYISYFDRILNGPAWNPADAVRLDNSTGTLRRGVLSGATAPAAAPVQADN